jgi:hypothetical protein
MRKGIVAALVPMVLAGLASPLYAAELRDYCPDRPGLGTPACIIDRGHASVEVGLADWTRDSSADERDTQAIFGDVLLRYGLTGTTELQVEWQGYGRDADLDRTTGIRSVTHRPGDLSIVLRQNLRNPDGSGFAVSVQPSLSLAVGRSPIGAGDWGAGLLVPMSYELNDSFAIEFVPEADAAVDGDGHGRHLAYGAVAGLAAKLSKAVTTTVELQELRDRDPAGHATMTLAGLSVGWQPRDNLQIDIGSNAGLNRNSPDIELYLGISRRF